MKRTLAATALFILSSTHAISLAQGIGSHWPSIVDPLVKSGITKVGNFDVLRFQAQAKDIQWKPLAGAPGLTQSGSRQSAYYVCGENTIHVSSQLPSEALSSLAGLELHELLGALCFDDRNYAMSTALSVLSRMADGVQRDKLIGAYARTSYFRRVQVAGATSVSGGGDLDSLYTKDQVLAAIMGDAQNQKAATTDFLVSYPVIDFEPVKNVSEVYVKYDYSFSSQREAFQIMIPTQRWHASKASRAALIHETAQRVKAIFPAYNGEHTHRFIPNACRAQGKNLAATYPVTADVNMLQIQEVRAALSLGCNPLEGADSFGITAPALAIVNEPKASGFYYFSCTATIAGRLVAKQDFRTKVGLGVLSSWFSRSLAGDDHLEISLGVDRRGRPIATYFIYRAPHGGHLTPTILPAGVSMPVEAQTRISGQTIHTSCQRVN